jgi:hypothetical protein
MKISTFLVHGSDLEARLCFLLLIEDPLIRKGTLREISTRMELLKLR